MPAEIPEPWSGFLRDLDSAAHGPAELHCLGGFVVSMKYGMPRPTADIDVLSVSPSAKQRELMELGRRGSRLHRKHGVYLDSVVLRVHPADYETRLTEMFPQALAKLRLMALDPYDLALTKLDRNSPRDREDFRHLAASIPFEMDRLRERYDDEMAAYVWDKTGRDLSLTLDLWIADVQELRARRDGNAR
jgi:hypothetical protein